MVPFRPHVLFLCLICGSLLGQTQPGWAPAEARAASRADRDRARTLLARGKKRMRQGHYPSAVRLFEQAYRFWPRREIQFNLALAHLELGDKLAAARHLRRYLAEATPAERKALPERFRRLQRQVGVLRVETDDPKVRIWIDGKRRGSGRVKVVVLPGTRAVELRRGSRVLARKELEVAGGREVVWDPPPLLPSRRRPPNPERRRPRRDDDQGRKRLHWGLFVTAAAVAVGAGAATTYTGVRTLQIRDELSRSYSDAAVKELERHELATNVLIAVTSAAVVTAAILAIFTRWREEPRPGDSATVRPTFGPGEVGIGVSVTY
jgi:tetratricopeptide (TPR) repeat protein